MSTLKDQGQAGTAGTAIDTLLWVIVGTTITLLGMALGALVLMKNGAINERLGMAFVILTFVALVVSDGVLVWAAPPPEPGRRRNTHCPSTERP